MRLQNGEKRRKISALALRSFGSIDSNLTLPDLIGGVTHDTLDAILNGKRWTLNTSLDLIENFENLNRGHYFPKTVIRNGDPDIRASWEPARLQHIILLLAVSNLNHTRAKQSQIFEYIRNEILCWIRNNPFLEGPHYASAMECGLRIIVFIYALKRLIGLSIYEKGEIAAAVYKHAWWISKRLSLYSSLGNHTICECIGLIFTGGLFRYRIKGQEWLERGIKLLNQELNHQILDDGGPAEQSIAYHRIVLDLFWLAYNYIDLNSFSDLRHWEGRLVSGERFISFFNESSGSLISIGDSDDGYAIAPGITPRKSTGTESALGAYLFEDAGYSVFSSEQITFTFDHGPLGMAPLYNHGHADALSITLSYRNKAILVDSGTYRYNGVPQWRRYFKSTRAHNTVTMDNQDQAIQASGVVWQKPYSCRLLKSERQKTYMRAVAEHDGYRRFNEPVTHRRTVELSISEILIEDSFRGKGSHIFELNYHLHPDAIIEPNGDGWIICIGEVRCFIKLMNGYDLTPANGRTDPIHGWYSPAYNIKQPTATLTCSKRGLPEKVIFGTHIKLL